MSSEKQSCDRQTKVTLPSAQLCQFNRFAAKVNKSGANLAMLDDQCRLLLSASAGRFESDYDRHAEYAREILQHRQESSGTSVERVHQFSDKSMLLGAAFKSSDGIAGTVLIDLGKWPGVEQDDQVAVATDYSRDTDSEMDTKTVGIAVSPKIEYMVDMLELFVETLELRCETEDQIELVSSQLAQTYEELVLLHKLSTNMKVTESDANYLQMACDSLTDIISVEGIAIILEKVVEDERKLVLAAGSGLIDTNEHLAAVLYSRLVEEMRSHKEALLDSDIDTPFKYDWPEHIRSLIAVPLYGTERSTAHSNDHGQSDNLPIGMMVAVNVVDRSDFDSTDVKLFNSVANGCAVFVENGRLFKDLKDLFIGSLKALTSSIDAKDQYTRGHSERVAFISRWIAERLAEKEPIEQELIHKIYLAGLLHDIGKLGIDEAVLRKRGKLTDQEFEHIRSHPSIGGGILRDIKQMRDIVAGVLCHHERVDGKGYPNGLSGDEIPIIGRIVGLADGFDAMTSRRVYRDAMSIEKALDEIRKGLGTQFDERIGRVFLESDVYQLWSIIQDGSDFFGMGGRSEFEEYGAEVVGTLLR